jgi:hypothetical protein
MAEAKEKVRKEMGRIRNLRSQNARLLARVRKLENEQSKISYREERLRRFAKELLVREKEIAALGERKVKTLVSRPNMRHKKYAETAAGKVKNNGK